MKIELSTKQTVIAVVMSVLVVIFATVGVVQAFSYAGKKMTDNRMERQKQIAKAHAIVGDAKRGDIVVFSELDRVSGWRQTAGFIQWVGYDFSISTWQPGRGYEKKLGKSELETLHIEIIKTSDQNKWNEAAVKLLRGVY